MGLWAKQVDDTQASGPSRWTTRQHLGQAGGRYESIWAKQVDDTRASGPKKEDTPQSSGPGKRIRSEHLGQRCNAHVRTRSPSPTVNKQSANSYINKQNPIKITITSQQNRQQMGCIFNSLIIIVVFISSLATTRHAPKATQGQPCR